MTATGFGLVSLILGAWLMLAGRKARGDAVVYFLGGTFSILLGLGLMLGWLSLREGTKVYDVPAATRLH